jgi:hypothetical protein
MSTLSQNVFFRWKRVEPIGREELKLITNFMKMNKIGWMWGKLQKVPLIKIGKNSIPIFDHFS